MKNLADVNLPDRPYYTVSLTRLIDKPIKDILCSISNEFGEPVVQLDYLLFEDDTELHFEGEHDIAYLADYNKPQLISDEQLEHLSEEVEAHE